MRPALKTGHFYFALTGMEITNSRILCLALLHYPASPRFGDIAHCLPSALRLEWPSRQQGGEYTMKKLLISMFTLFALISASSYAMAGESGLWEKTKAGANAAIEWTAEKSGQGWRATKAGADRLAAWTVKKSRSAWDATKKGAHQAAAWTAKQSRNSWEATKQGASDVAERLGRKTGKERKYDHHLSTGVAA